MICDIIIPVRNQAHWVALCVKELLANTPTKLLGDVLLVDDASYGDARTKIGRIATTNDAVRLLRQDRRGGFASAVNRGLGETSAPFILLLNSDCLLTRDAVPKLIAHFRKDERIGLVSPFSNNSAPLTVPLARGWTHQGMNSLLEEHFAGESMEACTIVGNALMISRECLGKAGSLDQAYGIGYFEETDYQFRAMRVGFTAAAALDTYVYHHGGASFGAEARFMKRANSEKFFSIWGHEYRQLAQRSPPYKPSHKVMSRLNSHIILGSLASRHRIHRESAYSRLNVLSDLL